MFLHAFLPQFIKRKIPRFIITLPHPFPEKHHFRLHVIMKRIVMQERRRSLHDFQEFERISVGHIFLHAVATLAHQLLPVLPRVRFCRDFIHPTVEWFQVKIIPRVSVELQRDGIHNHRPLHVITHAK